MDPIELQSMAKAHSMEDSKERADKDLEGVKVHCMRGSEEGAEKNLEEAKKLPAGNRKIGPSISFSLSDVKKEYKEEMPDLESLLEYNDIVKKTFDSEEEGFQFYNNYGYGKGFSAKTIAAGDVQTVISYLTAQQLKDPDFFFKYMVDGEGHLKGLFWCDSQYLLDYEAFGDVVVFNSTYKTNRYNVPLVPFVGVNHHRSTVIFGCGIVAHEDTESYVWLLRTFSEAMIHKHPVSVITDGDHAMQKAISLVWPNSSHRLCMWHIEQNIVRNVQDKDVRDELRTSLYDCCSIQEIESKWLQFLAKREVTDKDSWLYQMFDIREIWCAAYHVGECYLGLRSNQWSESLNSRLHMRLDRKMTLLDMVRHLDQCLSGVRNIENKLDFDALQAAECPDPGASTIEIDAAEKFTPTVFAMVKYSIKASNKCYSIEKLDGDNMRTYMVRQKNKQGMLYYVKCEFSDEGSLKGISCTCDKLQSIGTPCSHIFFALGDLEIEELPDCCVWKRYTMGAKNKGHNRRRCSMRNEESKLPEDLMDI